MCNPVNGEFYLDVFTIFSAKSVYASAQTLSQMVVVGKCGAIVLRMASAEVGGVQM
jgi:hypothetical protein